MKEHTGNIKVLLILIAMIISIAAEEAAVLVACLALSACVDEIRIQILFKERRQLTNMIKELRLSSDTQTGEIKTLQGLGREVKGEVRTQTRKINELIWATAGGFVATVVFGIASIFSEPFFNMLIRLRNRF